MSIFDIKGTLTPKKEGPQFWSERLMQSYLFDLYVYIYIMYKYIQYMLCINIYIYILALMVNHDRSQQKINCGQPYRVYIIHIIYHQCIVAFLLSKAALALQFYCILQVFQFQLRPLFGKVDIFVIFNFVMLANMPFFRKWKEFLLISFLKY